MGWLVLVGTEDVRGRAGVADRSRGLEVTEGERHLALGVEALDLVHPLVGRVDRDEPAERAAPDALVGEAVGLALGRRDRQLDGHRFGPDPRLWRSIPGSGDR